jgi:hypothetical protein
LGGVLVAIDANDPHLRDPVWGIHRKPWVVVRAAPDIDWIDAITETRRERNAIFFLVARIDDLDATAINRHIS